MEKRRLVEVTIVGDGAVEVADHKVLGDVRGVGDGGIGLLVFDVDTSFSRASKRQV